MTENNQETELILPVLPVLDCSVWIQPLGENHGCHLRRGSSDTRLLPPSQKKSFMSFTSTTRVFTLFTYDLVMSLYTDDMGGVGVSITTVHLCVLFFLVLFINSRSSITYILSFMSLF